MSVPTVPTGFCVVDLTGEDGDESRRTRTLIAEWPPGTAKLHESRANLPLGRQRAQVRRLTRSLREGHIVLVDGHGARSIRAVLRAARRAGIPRVICTVYPSDLEHRGVLKLVRRASQRGIDVVATNTDVAIALAAAGVSDEAIVVIENDEILTSKTRTMYEQPARDVWSPRRRAVIILAESPTTTSLLYSAAALGRRMDSRAELTMLTYHRVAPMAHDDLLDPSLISATPEAFEQQISLISRSHSPVDMNMVLAALAGETELPPRAVHITIDDAYTGVATHAAPILSRHGVPATLFVPTGYPDKPDMEFWWDRLYRSLLLSKKSEIASPVGTLVLDGGRGPARRAARLLAEHVKSLPHGEAMVLIDELVEDLGPSAPSNAVLGWTELETLRDYGITMAPHSRSHAALDRLPLESLVDETKGARDDLESRLPGAANVFAYPTGQTSPAVRQAVRDAGFSLALTTEPGRIRLSEYDPLSLPRFTITPRYNDAVFGALLTRRGCRLVAGAGD